MGLCVRLGLNVLHCHPICQSWQTQQCWACSSFFAICIVGLEPDAWSFNFYLFIYFTFLDVNELSTTVLHYLSESVCVYVCAFSNHICFSVSDNICCSFLSVQKRSHLNLYFLSPIYMYIHLLDISFQIKICMFIQWWSRNIYVWHAT